MECGFLKISNSFSPYLLFFFTLKPALKQASSKWLMLRAFKRETLNGPQLRLYQLSAKTSAWGFAGEKKLKLL